MFEYPMDRQSHPGLANSVVTDRTGWVPSICLLVKVMGTGFRSVIFSPPHPTPFIEEEAAIRGKGKLPKAITESEEEQRFELGTLD